MTDVVENVTIKPQNKNLAFKGTNVERFLHHYQIAADGSKASERDMARQLCVFVPDDALLDILETLDGYDPPDWPKLKAAMISYWGDINTARFTLKDISALRDEWVKKGGVASVADFQDFRKVWEPIQSYLLTKAHIDSEEEICNEYYQSFSTGVQERIRDQLIKDDTMITTADNRFKLPKFAILKTAITDVMKRQTALIFEDSKVAKVLVTMGFKESNEVMQKMEAERRPKEVVAAPTAPATVEDITKMMQSFEQRMEERLEQRFKKDGPSQGFQNQSSGNRPTIVCYYCLREFHGTAKCYELKKDKEQGLVTQEGNNFFLPNGALIPFDPSRPIRHIVASYQPSKPTTSFASAEFKAGCNTLKPWYPPAVSSQSFAQGYESDPAGRKRHEEAKPYKAPLAPPSMLRRNLRKTRSSPDEPADEPATTPIPALAKDVPREPVNDSMEEDSDEEPDLFERLPPVLGPDVEALGPDGSKPKSILKKSPKPGGSQPKARFERDAAKEHPHAAEDVIKRIAGLLVPDLSISELVAVSPAIAEGMKKWVSRRRVEVGKEELKVQAGTLAEGYEGQDEDSFPKLYSCPLGYLSCFIGDEGNAAQPLIDSGSQLNIISDSVANAFNISPRVNFSSAVYGINNQACELVGVAEDVVF
ncbi:hypothetical protein PSTG_01205 [Puccinia striiformis f. sp. tritici PST-78]|uniref:Uncharacterized protein n=1 Tax=Puccinia striiformis f. sp. tritici PST-78 TaxID=1165861 RepID=A0A0L0W2N9_9BASI|nr:hypothetical protein PSTG_01205 [Puccinia striiformis f. sp. tritici PST-78]